MDQFIQGSVFCRLLVGPAKEAASKEDNWIDQGSTWSDSEC